mgnify:CR=1 FL=1
MIEEADRSLHDALSVLSQTVKETRVVLGGGCAEMAMAVAVDEEAKTTEERRRWRSRRLRGLCGR